MPSIRARHVVTPSGVRDAVVDIHGGRIAAIRPPAADEAAVDLDDLWLLPGLVDTHVHVNEPGRTEWEGFATASRAALAGGITTFVDMPLNSIPATTTAAALETKRDAAASSAIDVGFWGGVVPGNHDQLEPLAAAGVLGFKCFLVPSGVPEFEAVTKSDLQRAMPILARLGLPLLVHAEDPEVLRDANPDDDPRAHATWLATRPCDAERRGIRLVLRLAAETGCAVHIVHVACADALDDLRGARRDGVAVTAETCPHYLVFSHEDVPDGATEFKCAPPIRERVHRERLWEGLEDGTLDLIASDHSPCPPAMKARESGRFLDAWGGIASLEVEFAATWTAARARGLDPARLARWMAEAPARLAGLADRKGAIEVGRDADLVAWDLGSEWTVEAAKLRQRHPITPYAGRTLLGRPRCVWRRGVCVASSDPRVPPAAAPPPGEVLRRASRAGDRLA